MNQERKKAKALGLCSGGLDSILAGVVLRQAGVEVHWVTFETPFFSADKAKRASKATGIPLIVRNITERYIPMLEQPNAGYGKFMNPCMDCHSLMFRIAGEMMKEMGYDFLFSGEVVGQRPMSQTKPSLRYVEKHSGCDGYILRPLSAKKLPETIPEKEGLVDREKLLDIAGRGRKRQIQLAKEFGITEYPAPAGGCLLTDKGYSRRLKDLMEHEEVLNEKRLNLLKVGRHFRVDDQTKIIVGRTKNDNDVILKYHDAGTDTVIRVKNYPGPTVLLPAGHSKNGVEAAAAICAGYSKAPNDQPVTVNVRIGGENRRITVLSLSPDHFKHLLI